MLSHLILKSILYFSATTFLCWINFEREIDSFNISLNAFIITLDSNKEAYLKITLSINITGLSLIRSTHFVHLYTTFLVIQISIMSLSFLYLLNKKHALKRRWPSSFRSLILMTRRSDLKAVSALEDSLLVWHSKQQLNTRVTSVFHI